MKQEPFRNLDVPEEEEKPMDEAVLLPGEEVFEEHEIDDGFSAARSSYVFNFLLLPFCLASYLRRDNRYSLFHAKQALGIWVGLMMALVLGMVLIPVGVGALIWLVGIPGLLYLNYLGMNQVQEEKAAPLPLLKKYPQEWFPADIDGEDE